MSTIERYAAEVLQQSFTPLAYLEIVRLLARDGPQESSGWAHYYANLKALLSRFLELVWNPRRFAPLIVDCLLLIQSTWTGRQLGPDLVYPMLGIKKRQSGYLAKLILEHSRDHQSYELQVAPTLPQGIHPFCVAIIDLDRVPLDVVDNSYSTQADFYGIVCMLTLIDVIIALTLHVLYGMDEGLNPLNNWGFCIFFGLFCCCDAARYGEGTLTLSRRSETSAPGCAVLLDQDFALILTGNQGVVEAIAGSNINLSYNSMLESIPLLDREERHSESFYDVLESLCEGICLAVLMLCWLMVVPLTAWGILVPLPALEIIAILLSVLQYSRRARASPDLSLWWWFAIKEYLFRTFPMFCVYFQYSQRLDSSPTSMFGWHIGTFSTYFFLLCVLSAGCKSRNYPIRTAKLLDVLGNPHVRKWQFNTLAAAATFQSLVLCHGIARPVDKHANTLAFLDVLVPDETDVWRVWKRRVADRIVHEQDISFTPTIPTFRDDQQQEELVDLLDQAQSGYRKYRDLYPRGAPPESAPAGGGSLSIHSLVRSSFQRLLSFAPFIGNGYRRRLLP